MHLPKGGGHVRYIDHATAGKADFAAMVLGRIDNLLDAVDIRGKGRHDDAALRRAEKGLKGLADLALADRRARAFHIGALPQQTEHALFTQQSKLCKVGGHAVDGRIIDLKIAGMYYRPHRRMDSQRYRPGDTVAHLNEFDGKAADTDLIAGCDGIELGVVDAVLFQLIFNQP